MAMEEDAIGECCNCITEGPLGEFCTNCEGNFCTNVKDPGYTYEQSDAIVGECDNCNTKGPLGYICNFCTKFEDTSLFNIYGFAADAFDAEDNSNNNQELWDPIPYCVQLDLKAELLREAIYADKVYFLMREIGMNEFNTNYRINSAQKWGRMWSDRFESIGIKSIQQLVGNLLRLKEMLASKGILISDKLLDCIAFYGSSFMVMFLDISKFPIIKCDSNDEERDAIVKMMRTNEVAKECDAIVKMIRENEEAKLKAELKLLRDNKKQP
jgi:hypothetical protein